MRSARSIRFVARDGVGGGGDRGDLGLLGNGHCDSRGGPAPGWEYLTTQSPPGRPRVDTACGLWPAAPSCLREVGGASCRSSK